MRTDPGVYRLTFLLPVVLRLSVPEGRHTPCLHGCVLRVTRDFVVSIEGPSRELLFEQATRFLKVHARRAGPLSIAATLQSPALDRFGRPLTGGRDGWSIIVGARISFSPTSLDPYLPQSDGDAERVGVGE